MKKSRLFLAVIAGSAVFLCVVAPHAGGAARDPKPSIREEPSGELTLRRALELAFAGNPDLAAFSWEVRSGDPRIQQAGLIPNPELGVDVENILGSGPSRKFDSVETTLSISQLVELGGKRAARIRRASAEKSVVGWDYEAKRADLAAEVAKSFVEVLSAQERLTLAKEMARLAKEILNAVSARVTAGKISPVEETKAPVASPSAGSSWESHELPGSGQDETGRDVGKRRADVFQSRRPTGPVGPDPVREVLADRISRNPDIARWAAEMEQRKATLAQERANRIADVTLSGGIRRSREAKDTSFVFGAAIPLPLFHRNQGKILESQYRISKAESERSRPQGTRFSPPFPRPTRRWPPDTWRRRP